MTLVVPGTDVRVPSLGYGCASLMARTGRAESVRLLEAAFDAGITHFDVARSYGYGDAESAVGDFLARRRGQVTVATKLGVAPPERTRALGAARASRMVTSGRFGVEDARASLERSLRELRTGVVDVLLLHDCQPDDLHDDLLDFLQGRVQGGDIRAFGVATDRASAEHIVGSRAEFAPLVQVPDSVLHPPLTGLGPAVSTHSVVVSAQGTLLEHCARDDRARRWSEAVGADVRDPAVLARLLLAAALRRNAGGTVLCSSRDPDHVRANAALVRDAPPAQLDALTALVASDFPRLGAATGASALRATGPDGAQGTRLDGHR